VFDEEEEQWYFVDAKKIRPGTKEQSKRQVFIVHSDCMKQLEMNREL
jgi:hypothetical protein